MAGLVFICLLILAATIGPMMSPYSYFQQNLELSNLPPMYRAHDVGGQPSASCAARSAKARAGFHGPAGTGLSQLVNGMGGAEHIASILTGYTGEEKEEAGTTFYANTAFPGGWISMAPPLAGEDVEFADGHSNSLHHEAEDVAAFLMWAAEPKMMQRKMYGLTAVIFLSVLTVLLYATNKRLWKPVKKAAKGA